MNELILGVDGGGSKTVALLAGANGQVIGRGQSGSANYLSVGRTAAQAAVIEAIKAAYQNAGLPFQPAEALCLGMAGVNLAEDPDWARHWALSEKLSRRVIVTDDLELTLVAGTPQGWGIGVISGTGAVVTAKTADGRKGRAGGWGYILGDEGSGYAIGMDALRAVTRAADLNAPPTLLTDLILKEWGLAVVEDLFKRLYIDGVSRREIACLSRQVAEAAAGGDAVAREILAETGEALGRLVTAVVRQLKFEQDIPCSLVGGVITNIPIVSATMIETANKNQITLKPIRMVADLAQGAVRLARNLLG
jgi:N-acetylglucosamine kinase-like BadF-type ATPase